MAIAETVRSALEATGLPDWLIVALLTVTPVLEVRASIPVAILVYGWHWLPTAIVTFLASLLIIPLALATLKLMERLARRFQRPAKMLDWLWARTRRKTPTAERAGKAGLFAIVALPLPGAGTWTACITAYVLGMDTRKAALTIVLGAIAEVAILVVVTLFFQGALQWLG